VASVLVLGASVVFAGSLPQAQRESTITSARARAKGFFIITFSSLDNPDGESAFQRLYHNTGKAAFQPQNAAESRRRSLISLSSY
jgi:hypothetical protein